MSDPTGTRTLRDLRMDAVAALSALAAQGRIHLGHRRAPFLGIMLGVATLIIVMAVMNGFRKELLDKILGPQRPSAGAAAGAAAHRLGGGRRTHRGVQGIRLAAPIVEGQALASSPFNISACWCAASVGRPQQAHLDRQQPEAGDAGGLRHGQGLAIGRRLSDQLSVRAGDNITLVSPRGAVTPMGTTPRIKTYKVAAVFEIGMSEYDGSIVFMPLPEAQLYFNRAAT